MSLSKGTTVLFEGQEQRAEPVEVVKSEEPWAVYELADGTTLRLRQMVVAVYKLLDRRKETGEPIYVWEAVSVAHASVPAEMRQEPLRIGDPQ